MIGSCSERLSEIDDAIVAYKKTLEIDTSNISAGIAGYNLSKVASPADRGFFEAFLGGWEQHGLLTDEMKGMLK